MVELIKKVVVKGDRKYTNLYIRYNGHDYPITAKDFGKGYENSTHATWVSLVTIATEDK